MLISKKNRLAILTYLFKEGVIVAKKDYNLPKHPEVTEVSNLEVIKLCTSLTSRDLVSCRFAWKHYYWFLTDEGIEYLREYLHLPEDSVPNTLKKSTRPTAPPGRGSRTTARRAARAASAAAATATATAAAAAAATGRAASAAARRRRKQTPPRAPPPRPPSEREAGQQPAAEPGPGYLRGLASGVAVLHSFISEDAEDKFS